VLLVIKRGRFPRRSHRHDSVNAAFDLVLDNARQRRVVNVTAPVERSDDGCIRSAKWQLRLHRAGKIGKSRRFSQPFLGIFWCQAPTMGVGMVYSARDRSKSEILDPKETALA
jgi:hypothetical protein